MPTEQKAYKQPQSVKVHAGNGHGGFQSACCTEQMAVHRFGRADRRDARAKGGRQGLRLHHVTGIRARGMGIDGVNV